ncbi:MAG: DUF2085 domain-containing protein [bacterium]
MDLYDLSFKICGYLCHQLPERSFFLFGAQFPLCFRCSGILIGSLIFPVLAYRSALPGPKVALLLLLPMVVDVTLLSTATWESTTVIRVLTGLGFGVGAPAVLLRLMLLKESSGCS